MPTKLTSKRIDRTTADKEIKKYGALSKMQDKLIRTATAKVQKDEQSEFKNFSREKFNAFIFPTADLKRFMTKNPKGNSGKCKYMMVIFGAHFENSGQFKKGMRTVIVAGVNESRKMNNGKPTFRTLSIPDPGQEYPPHFVVPSLPGTFEGDFMEFTIS